MGNRLTAAVLTVCGAIGALAAFVLIIERIKLITDPEYRPTCSINPILSCGSIMKTDQAELFGFPNPLIGLATFPIVATIGTAYRCPAAALDVARAQRRRGARRGVRPLAVLPEPVPHRCTVAILHGGVGGHDHRVLVRHLGHLFHDQLGLPYPAWRRWTRLRHAIDHLQAGATLTQAAHAAGFADSAHLTRTCRAMFGITPTDALRAADWRP